MTVSTIGVADAGTPDKYLHTNQRTISSTAREDQYVLQGESAYPTYTVTGDSISAATANSHTLQIMGDGSNYSRIKRIHVVPYYVTTASIFRFAIVRLSSAGTSGSAITPAPFDTSDTYGGGAASLPSSKGTEGAVLMAFTVVAPTATPALPHTQFTWEPPLGTKPIIFGTATSNGIALKNIDGKSGGLVFATIEFITTSYL